MLYTCRSRLDTVLGYSIHSIKRDAMSSDTLRQRRVPASARSGVKDAHTVDTVESKHAKSYVSNDSAARRSSQSMFALSLLTLLPIRLYGALHTPIMDCDEVFNFWEPLHLLQRRSGMQTWEYAPQYALRSYAFIHLYKLVADMCDMSGLSSFVAHRQSGVCDRGLQRQRRRHILGLAMRFGCALCSVRSHIHHCSSLAIQRVIQVESIKTIQASRSINAALSRNVAWSLAQCTVSAASITRPSLSAAVNSGMACITSPDCDSDCVRVCASGVAIQCSHVHSTRSSRSASIYSLRRQNAIRCFSQTDRSHSRICLCHCWIISGNRLVLLPQVRRGSTEHCSVQ